MGFWGFGFVTGRDVTPNTTTETPPSVGPDSSPGDPEGLVLEGEDTFSGQRAAIHPSPWDGWPETWNVPSWGLGSRFDDLVDTAWTCIDLNSSVLSTMPVYRTRGGVIIEPLSWMTNPDPEVYPSWAEFAKELFWEYQMGEAFVLATDFFANGLPSRFRVIPQWAVNVELNTQGRREYRIGPNDVTDQILHIRYRSTTQEARGHGPLESGRTRLVAAGVLASYAAEVARGGGIPYYVIEVPNRLTTDQARDLLAVWWESRKQSLGQPGIVSHGGRARQVQMTAQDIGLTDLAKFNEARIATMLGVPPFLVGLPMGESMTYSNVTGLFEFHDRAFLRPKANTAMQALSGWALPRGQMAELNRDEYSRPSFGDRAEAYERLAGIVDPETGRPAISVEEIRTMERFRNTPQTSESSADPVLAAFELTGGGNGFRG